MNDTKWLAVAREYVGTHEIKGSRHEPKILAMIDKMGKYTGEQPAWWREDETAWCGLFVGFCLGEAERYVIPAWYRAKAWASDPEMTKLRQPAFGSVAVFSRSGGGHVGFVVGKDRAGHLMILGGNQSDAVNIKPFSLDRLEGCYWPAKWRDHKPQPAVPYLARYNLPRLKSNGEVSTNEA